MKFTVMVALMALLIFLLNPVSAARHESVLVKPGDSEASRMMNRVAEEFIVLAFCLSKTDENYVDAYFGPPELKQKGLGSTLSLENIRDQAEKLIQSLQQLEVTKISQENRPRQRFLYRMIQAMVVRINMMRDDKLSFNQESEGLYNVTLPRMELAEFHKIRQQLDALVPGRGDLGDRLKVFRKQFIIPDDKVGPVFQTALNEARKRSRKRLPLPDNEKFSMELVKGQSWQAYNWFKGNSRSLIQVNTDIPLTIDQMVGLACHEGYPGHHVFHCLLEKILYRGKGWLEFSIYPLFSPMSVIAEGLGNFAVELAFPDNEQLKFESGVLCPLAGIDPKNLEQYHQILKTSGLLKRARNLIARDFLDGRMSEEAAVEKIRELLVRSPESARQSLEFIKTYRSYILTYTVGEDLVRRYILEKAGVGHPEKQWAVFLDLMTRPVLPEDLK